MTGHVVLLHGIWLRGFTLGLLARRLREGGLEVSSRDYASVTRSPEQSIDSVADYLAVLPPGPVHLVGHSLGGLLALALARRGHLPADSRIVCLGTPLRGSAVARLLAGLLPLRWTLGQARDLLCRGLEDWPDGVPVAMVAGNLPLGLGLLVPGLERPHDGMVAVAETRAPQLAAHRCVAASHSGLLLSDAAARLALAFLRDGRFPPEDAGAPVADPLP